MCRIVTKPRRGVRKQFVHAHVRFKASLAQQYAKAAREGCCVGYLIFFRISCAHKGHLYLRVPCISHFFFSPSPSFSLSNKTPVTVCTVAYYKRWSHARGQWTLPSQKRLWRARTGQLATPINSIPVNQQTLQPTNHDGSIAPEDLRGVENLRRPRTPIAQPARTPPQASAPYW